MADLARTARPGGMTNETIAPVESLTDMLSASRRLHEISTQLVQQHDPEAIYLQILDAAVEIMQSDFASIQRLNDDTGELELLASVGFSDYARTFWARVPAGSITSCGRALKLGQRVITPDVDQADFLVGTEDLAVYHETGMRAIQSTPLIARNGCVLGMISTHWREPCVPGSERLRLLDILARQAADLIERAAAEVALQRSQSELKAAFQRTEDALRAKDELIGLISHEFRNPLVTILGNINVLRRRSDIDAETWERMIEDLDRDGQRLRFLIENMLVLTRAEHAAEWLEPVLLQRLLPKLVQAEQLKDRSRDLTVTVPPDLPPALASPGYLAQLLENLITNSRKYGSPEAPIEIVAEGGTCLTVTVRDRGQCYTDADVGRFLEPFFRSPNNPPRTGGLGLGMSVCARLAELQGGNFTLRPRVGGGIEAIFNLQPADTDP